METNVQLGSVTDGTLIVVKLPKHRVSDLSSKD